jgi:hypothetical protein
MCPVGDLMIKRRVFFLVTILTLLLIAVFAIGIKRHIPEKIATWKEYKNSGCSYQLDYPDSWLIEASQYRNPCEVYKDIKCVASQSVYITNKRPSQLFIWKKRLFNSPPGDIGPPDVTTFSLNCSQTKYSSIEEWVREIWLGTNDDVSIKKKTQEKIKKLTLGAISLPVFIAVDTKEYTTQRSGLTSYFRWHFIYKGHEYHIEGESGSIEQLKKDEEILDKILQSIKLL